MINKILTVSVNLNCNIEKAWKYWNDPICITNWYFAADTWHAPTAENELEIGKTFNIRMEAKDGSIGFNLIGLYEEIIPLQLIKYSLEDGRKVETIFEVANNQTIVTQHFNPENENTLELQQNGWQAILNNYKLYVENN